MRRFAGPRWPPTPKHWPALADDPAIRVRLHAALALGDRCQQGTGRPRGSGRIAARDAGDPWMRLAILSGLAESAPGLHPPVRQDRGLRGPLRPALAVRRDRRGSQPCAGAGDLDRHDRRPEPRRDEGRHDPARRPGRRPGTSRPAAEHPGRLASGRLEGTTRTAGAAVADRIHNGHLEPPGPRAPRGPRRSGAGPSRPGRADHPRSAGGRPAEGDPGGRRAGRRPGRSDLRWPTRRSTAGNRWRWPRAASCSRPWPARPLWPSR